MQDYNISMKIYKIKNFIELLLLFTICIAYLYFFEFLILIIKNYINKNPLFEFPAGFMYVGFI